MTRTTLDRMTPGQSGRVLALSGSPALVQRLMEFGILEGDEIEFVALAPLGDPLELRVGSTRLSLRRADAVGIAVELLPNLPGQPQSMS